MSGVITVTLVATLGPGQVEEATHTLPAGSTVAQALQAAGWACRASSASEVGEIGVWGRRCPPDHVLHDHDRIELYRPLQVDPKVARKARFGRQGARTAGLFARRRPGAKPGY